MVNKTRQLKARQKPLRLTAKREKFCQLIVAGENKGDAAKKAGFKGKWPNSTARDLLHIPAISARIDQLLIEFAAEQQYTRAQALEELEQARKHAVAQKQPSAEVMAVRGKAKICGFERDVLEVTESAGRQISLEEQRQLTAAAQAAATAARGRLKLVKVA